MSNWLQAIVDFFNRLSLPNLVRVFLFLVLLFDIPLTVIAVLHTRSVASLAITGAEFCVSIDFDNNDRITVSDIQRVAGRLDNPSVYDSQYDITKDGVIDQIDYDIISTWYGVSCFSPLPTPPTPGANVMANGNNGPITIPYNSGATITWTSSNAVSCVVTPPKWRGISGSQPTGNLTSSQTYTLKCYNYFAVLGSDLVVVNVSPPPCTDECSSGAKKCTSSTSYQTCGNYDADSCLEWSSAASCPAGQTCSGNGACSSLGGGGSGGKKTSGGGTRTLDSLQLEISVPYLVGSLKVKADVGGVSKDIEITTANKSYTLDLKGSNLSLGKEYILTVTSTKTLVRKTKFTPTTSSTTVKVADLILGDINQDNSVDSTDQISLINSLKSQTLQGDLNDDKITNSFDWAILLTNFGKKGD